MTLVKHVEQHVIRDANGRVLRTESHEWPEAQAHATAHAAAIKALTADRDEWRAKYESVTDALKQLNGYFERQAAVWSREDADRAGQLKAVLAERDADVIRERD